MEIDFIKQIIDKLQAYFSSREDEYKDTIVKEIYKPLPQGQYPKVIVSEIDNSEMISRSTLQGERTTNLGYQITCYSRDMEQFDKIDSVRFMASLVDNVMSGYYKMQRLGSPRSTTVYRR